jgi:acyl-[acyl-carrier-protein] desaturase
VPDRHPDHDLLWELEPVAERLLDRHLAMAKDWLPHQYIPWSLGRDFDTEPWTPDQPRLTGVAQAAFEVNLLTEDNLPSYHRELLATFGRDRAWRTWAHRWTAEEGRHAVVLRDYLLVTRNIDPRRPGTRTDGHHAAGLDAGQDGVGADGLCRLPGTGHPDLPSQHRPLLR